MEYTSPGSSWCSWWWFASSAKGRFATLYLVALTSIIWTEVTCQLHHEIRHGKHYQHPYQGYDMEPSYEPSTVVPKPEILDDPSNYTVHAGKMATLKCAVHNLGTKSVVWRRVLDADDENNILTVGQLTWSKEEEDAGTYYSVDYRLDPRSITISHWNLLIKNVKPRHEGKYECQITDKEPLRKYIFLKVLPPIISKPAVVLTGEGVVDLNEPLHLKCNATGGDKVPSEIDWFKDGSKLNEPMTGRVVVTKYTLSAEKALISELFIDHAEATDSGNYICRSSDKKIDSIRVTVLTAGTVNVKRGTGSHTGDENTSENGSRSTFVTCHLFFLLFVSFITRILTMLS